MKRRTKGQRLIQTPYNNFVKAPSGSRLVHRAIPSRVRDLTVEVCITQAILRNQRS